MLHKNVALQVSEQNRLVQMQLGVLQPIDIDNEVKMRTTDATGTGKKYRKIRLIFLIYAFVWRCASNASQLIQFERSNLNKCNLDFESVQVRDTLVALALLKGKQIKIYKKIYNKLTKKKLIEILYLKINMEIK